MSRKISELLSVIPSGYELSMKLLDMLQEGCTSKNMLKYAYTVLGNPIMLVDVTFNYETSSGTDDINSEPVWEYTRKNGFMPNSYLNHIASVEYLHAKDSNIIEERQGRLLKHDQVMARVMRNGNLVGYLFLLQVNKEISETDRNILQLISNILPSTMSRREAYEDISSSVVENFLASIIKNKITDPEEIKSRQELFGIRLYDILHVITIKLEGYNTNEDRRYNLLVKVKHIFNKNNVMLVDDHIVVLYDTKSGEEAFFPQLHNELKLLMIRYDSIANISFPFISLTKFYSYYLQTLYCMNLHEKIDIPGPIIKYEDYIVYHMLSRFSEITDMNLMIHDAIKELQELDINNDSEYIDTLFAYVNCQQNMSRAAERMQVHYNTLKYRINRIIEMTGLDLSDENSVFSIMISERILRVRKRLEEIRHNFEMNKG